RLKESLFLRQAEETSRYLMEVPDDSWLYGFRKRAGKPSPGTELFGWYGHGIFHVFGQMLGGMVKLAAGTANPDLATKAIRLAEGWASCMEKDGYCCYKPRGAVNDLHYEYEKLLGGLLDLHEYAGYDKALAWASSMTDWAMANLDREIVHRYREPAKVNFTFYREWYTLSENLYRAFELTGDEKYRTFAKVWEYPDYWNRFLDPVSTLEPCHASSHVNTLSGSARAYRVTGDERYLRIIENAYKRIFPEHTYATGGYGPAEGLFGQPGYLGRMLLEAPKNGFGNAEIPCGTWAVFKLTRYLMELTREAPYSAWAERLLYNGIGAELPMHPEGRVMYYANYHVDGASKAVEFEMSALNTTGTALEWPCCSGTYPQAVAEVCNLIGYRTSDGIDLCQYVPCTIRWSKTLSFELDTRYPAEEEVTITARVASPADCAVRLRQPDWVGPEAMTVEVNGQPVPSGVDGGWVAVSRRWRDGDRLRLRIPLRLRLDAVDRQKPDLCAVSFGPVTLAANRPGVFTADALHPQLWIEREPGTLSFRSRPGVVKGYPQMSKWFKPFWEYGLGERYHLYNKVERPLSWPT
ncbi:MAG TPA: beta-L-arabinofuranosidase domain-containing protein, partial [Spirochaetia bacterium]|nr:beta-L-arabinofuranosidase domain-containing protein [Spirochaetia bacterium]